MSQSTTRWSRRKHSDRNRQLITDLVSSRSQVDSPDTCAQQFRPDLVAQVKVNIQEGYYDDLDKLGSALEKMLDVIV